MELIYSRVKVAERAGTGTRDSARWRAREERIGFVKALCGLRGSHSVDFYLGVKTPHRLQVGQFDHLFDHCFTWRHRSGVLRWDDPYLRSSHMQDEFSLRARGFHVIHLPLEMSLHVRGECQPRLTASPGVELEHIRRLLVVARFETPLTREFWDLSYARVAGPASVIQ